MSDRASLPDQTSRWAPFTTEELREIRAALYTLRLEAEATEPISVPLEKSVEAEIQRRERLAEQSEYDDPAKHLDAHRGLWERP